MSVYMISMKNAWIDKHCNTECFSNGCPDDCPILNLKKAKEYKEIGIIEKDIDGKEYLASKKIWIEE